MHRRSFSVVLMLGGLFLPMFAQRVGSSGQGNNLEGYVGPAYSSYSAVGRFGSLITAQYGTMNVPQVGVSPLTRPGVSQSPFVHPDPFVDQRRYFSDSRIDRDRSGRGRDDRRHGIYPDQHGFGFPYNIGWFSPGYVGYSDPGFDGNPANPAQQPEPPALASEYGATPAQQSAYRADSSQAILASKQEISSAPQATAAPSSTYRQSYKKPQADLGIEAAVTLIFKDGRPSEQIRNYMLTRKTLYVQEQRLREIPVDQLDLAATEKVNQDAGVEFRLPDTPR